MPAKIAVVTKMRSARRPKRCSWGRHSLGGRAIMVSKATPPAQGHGAQVSYLLQHTYSPAEISACVVEGEMQACTS